jgi:uncharacterized protein (TIGR02001 family)
MKKLLVAATLAGSVFTYSALAESDHSVSANVGVFTNYVFRGESFTDEGPALQGGVDYGHSSGVYTGIWASNLDDGTDTAFEIDLYAGFSGEAGDFGYDVGLTHFIETFDGADPYQEAHLGGSFRNFSLTYYKGVTTDENDKYSYLQLGADFDFEVLALALHAGHADDDGETANDAALTVSKDNFSFAPGHAFGVSVSHHTELTEDETKAFAFWTTSFDF